MILRKNVSRLDLIPFHKRNQNKNTQCIQIPKMCENKNQNPCCYQHIISIFMLQRLTKPPYCPGSDKAEANTIEYQLTSDDPFVHKP